jgi:glucose-6-phosphate dehydrogenase assembly protein OpcA
MLLNICTVEHVLQFASAVFAGLAAWRWLVASLVTVPPGTERATTLDSLDHVYPIISRQSRLNAQAALFAGIAALLQLPQAFMPTCWG